MIIKIQRPLATTEKDAAFLLYDETKRCTIRVSMSDAEVAPILFMLFFKAAKTFEEEGVTSLEDTPEKIYVEMALDEHKMLLIDEDSTILDDEPDW